MEPAGYVRAVVARWVWAAAAGTLGVLLGTAFGLLSPTAYQADVTLYVDAALIAEEQDPSSAAEVRTTVLPSVARLTTSTPVLDEVARALDLDASAAALAADLDVVRDKRASVLHLSATRATPEEATDLVLAVGDEVRRQSAVLFGGTDGPMLTVTAVGDASGALPASRSTSALAALGLVAGVGAAAQAARVAELARPRVRSRADVARLTTAPVLALLPRDGAPPERRPAWLARLLGAAPQRAEELARVRMALGAAPSDGSARRIAVVGAGGVPSSLAAELAAQGLEIVAAPDPQALPPTGVDGVLVISDGRGTGTRELRATLDAVDAAGLPLAGVVVDGLLPPGAGWRALLRAGSRAEATWLVDGRSRPSGGRASRISSQAVAAPAVAAVGFTQPLPMGLSAGLLAAVALLPLWLPVVRRYRGLALLFVLAGVGLVCGALIAWALADDHAFAPHEAVVRGTAVLGAVGGIGVLVWARGILSVPVLGSVFGLAMLATELSEMSGPENLWKFQLSSPVMVIGMALAARRGNPLVTVGALGVLGLLNIVNDARSAFGFCAVAAALVLWQQRPGRDRPVRRSRQLLMLPVLGVVGAAAYSLMTQLMLAGALGSEIQQRTATQIAQSGSLLLGGRPEWTATWALMHERPFGFGLGIVPNSTDVLVATEGISVTHIPTAENYLRNYMLDGGVQLHSIVADLWSALGPAGILLGLAMGALVLLGLADRLGRREASGLVCLLVPMALWALPFGPMASNIDTLTLALGLLLMARRPRGADEPATGAADPAHSALVAA
jgi:capsular polysaccharide biosynthesis protein